MHAEPDTATREEVKYGFPEFLTVYLNADIRAQFREFLDPNPRSRGGDPMRWWDASYSYEIKNKISEVRSALLAHRLDSDRQNLAAREIVQKIMDDLFVARNGDDEEQVVLAAATLAHLVPILVEHYQFVDPRTPEQVAADAAYISGVAKESDAIPGEQRVKNHFSELSTADLKNLFSVASKPADELSEADVKFLYDNNPQAHAKSLPYTGEETTALDRWLRAKAELEVVKDIPSKYLPFLDSKKTPEALRETLDKELSIITHVRESHSYWPYGRVTGTNKSVARIAAHTLSVRKKNRRLVEAIIAAV